MSNVDLGAYHHYLFSMNEEAARKELTDTMRFFHAKGWTPGTGGNFSIVLERSPLKLLMSPSGVDKGRVESKDLIIVDDSGSVVSGEGKASAETLLHTTIVQETQAGSVLHIHSIWNTLLSRKHLSSGGITLAGFEMLKSLAGNNTHECEEHIPIIQNSQDMNLVSKEVSRILKTNQKCKGILLSGHGLYTWGHDVYSARRHVEGLEFLFEAYAHETFYS